MAETMASQQAPADVSVAGLTRFKEGDPTVFPPAAEVLRFAKERLAVGRPGRASPRQVRLPDGDVWKRRQGKGQNSSPAKAAHCAANRGSASQDDGAITAVVGRLDVLAGTKQHPQEGPQAQAQEQIRPKRGGAVALLLRPLASVLPATQAAPNNLAHLLRPPPTVRQQPAAAPIQPDHEEAGGVVQNGWPRAGRFFLQVPCSRNRRPWCPWCPSSRRRHGPFIYWRVRRVNPRGCVAPLAEPNCNRS